MKTLSKMVLLICISSFHNGAYAVSGDLGAWLRSEAGPALVALIRNEPRFIGEAIEIVALNQGQPAAIDSALTEDISEELRQILLSHSGIRIPLPSHNTCQASATKIVLGIETDRSGRTNHRIMIALLDLDENIWINQSPQTWTGRLTSNQSRLWSRQVDYRPLAFHPNDSQAITLALDEQIQCHGLLAEPVNIQSDNNPLRAELVARLSRHTAVTDDASAAATVLSVDAVNNDSVVVKLQNGGSSFPIASVKLTPKPDPVRLLSDISLSQRKSECRGHGRTCVDIEYEILDDAYVFEFFTQKGELVSLSCDTEPDSRSGAVRKGLKVPPADRSERPSLGYYVLATHNPRVARKLATDLNEASQHCGGSPDETQLEDLSELVTRNDVSWQALHLINRGGRVHVL